MPRKISRNAHYSTGCNTSIIIKWLKLLFSFFLLNFLFVVLSLCICFCGYTKYNTLLHQRLCNNIYVVPMLNVIPIWNTHTICAVKNKQAWNAQTLTHTIVVSYILTHARKVYVTIRLVRPNRQRKKYRKNFLFPTHEYVCCTLDFIWCNKNQINRRHSKSNALTQTYTDLFNLFECAYSYYNRMV